MWWFMTENWTRGRAEYRKIRANSHACQCTVVVHSPRDHCVSNSVTFSGSSSRCAPHFSAFSTTQGSISLAKLMLPWTQQKAVMRFCIDLGNNEKHTFEFNFNQLLGRSVVKVNGQVVYRKARWFSEPLVDNYAFEVGQFERVCVRIEKMRKRLFASKYCVYVDNRLTQLHQGV